MKADMEGFTRERTTSFLNVEGGMARRDIGNRKRDRQEEWKTD